MECKAKNLVAGWPAPCRLLDWTPPPPRVGGGMVVAKQSPFQRGGGPRPMGFHGPGLAYP